MCTRCGRPARGFAEINGDRYCHGGTSNVLSGTAALTCYEQETHERQVLQAMQWKTLR